jgi:hypothetical protein
MRLPAQANESKSNVESSTVGRRHIGLTRRTPVGQGMGEYLCRFCRVCSGSAIGNADCFLAYGRNHHRIQILAHKAQRFSQ